MTIGFSSSPRTTTIATIAVLLCAGAIVFFLLAGRGSDQADNDGQQINSSSADLAKGRGANAHARSARSSLGKRKPIVVPLHPAIETLISEIQKADGDAETIMAARAALREELAGLNREHAVSILIDALGAGVKMQTQLDFAIDEKGFLTSPESIEGLLLDEVSFWDPAKGALAAENLLNSGGLELAERITALRAYAYGNGLDYADAKNNDFFIKQITAIFDNISPGIKATTKELAVFDLATFTNSSSLNERLIEMAAAKPDRDYVGGTWSASDAAFYALDRIVTDDFHANMEQLQQSSVWLRLDGKDKTMLYTRANVREAEDRTLLENFIFDPARSEVERDLFIANFPNGNVYQGNNVIPLLPNVSDRALRQIDTDALEMARKWKKNPAYQQHEVFVDSIIEKLEGYVEN